MKKIILFLAMALSGYSVYAQNTFPSTGNVGIGTTSPATLLDVSGAFTSGTYNSNDNTFQPVAFYRYNGISGISYPGQFRWYASPNNSLHKDAAQFQLRAWDIGSNTENTILTIRGDGAMGIGTAVPDQMLTVNGTIHSTEVKVTATVPGPDYVFEPTYKLLDLNALKNYLSINHHLPEIPSAAEMDKNGLNLSEMNLKLLKKVEELTLYLIDNNKIVSEQNAKIIEQQTKIDLLQQQQKEIDDLKKQVKLLLKARSN